MLSEEMGCFSVLWMGGYVTLGKTPSAVKAWTYDGMRSDEFAYTMDFVQRDLTKLTF